MAQCVDCLRLKAELKELKEKYIRLLKVKEGLSEERERFIRQMGDCG